MKVIKSTIGVIGLGWSGSGALIELMESNTKVSRFPYEMDFWRRPRGFLYVESRKDFIKTNLKELLLANKIIIKSIFKVVINYKEFKKILATIISQIKLLLVLFSSLLHSIFNKSYEENMKFFVRIFKSIFGKNEGILILDQPLFLEQIEDESLGFLDADISFIVIRNIYDQVQDIIDNHYYLNVSSIREGFFIGSYNDLEKGIESQQLEIMLQTLKKRISVLKSIILKYSTKFMIIEFEELIKNTKPCADKINNFAVMNGCQNSLVNDNQKDIFKDSLKNINIGKDLLNSTHKNILKDLDFELKEIVNLSRKNI